MVVVAASMSFASFIAVSDVGRYVGEMSGANVFTSSRTVNARWSVRSLHHCIDASTTNAGSSSTMAADTRQLADLANQLIMESRRSTATDTLLKYNDPLIRKIIREQRALEGLVDAALVSVNDPTQIPPSVIIHQTTITRNKRCLLAYHHHRMNFLKDLFWSLGGALPPLLSNPQVRANLAPHEVDFLREYNTMIGGYRADFSQELDITSGITDPPKDIHVLVRVVKDCGVVQTEVGSIDFQKGQRFMVRKSDIEHLIVQGFLEEVQR